MTMAGFLAYALALGVAAAIPGPGVVALVARALASGFWAGMAFAAGLMLGDLTFLAAAVFGLTRVAEALGDVFVVVRIGAGLYLGYLAIHLWRAAARAQPVASRSADRPLASFLAGLTVTLANPKTIVFYLAVLPTLLDLRAVSLSDFAVLVAVTALVLVAVMTPYAALASRARHALQTAAFHRRLNRSAAAIMAGAAIWTVARRA
ncbi:Threonine/homoserine/homoserine lactone efflux protein [Methylobacterium phyllostachyos]|uniref:Threonine/homoserine/homoserine lactone efflux protein n=1 Tax=Methylobacterium phyllostachyos TaxID=582672 RepID=A0A1G9ZJC7_9HYPH|nr:LysE family translocator [Methylobacterium phyllostachyos]SDN21195.1 Threonine/homoserine/homoserine lactone efflux protein [Methylobacterium phyllostachyos]